jgi:hypothetical protein
LSLRWPSLRLPPHLLALPAAAPVSAILVLMRADAAVVVTEVAVAILATVGSDSLIAAFNNMVQPSQTG